MCSVTEDHKGALPSGCPQPSGKGSRLNKHTWRRVTGALTGKTGLWMTLRMKIPLAETVVLRHTQTHTHTHAQSHSKFTYKVVTQIFLVFLI